MTKKILYLVPYIPNQIRVRPYNLIRSLSELGHEITLLTLWTNKEELDSLDPLRPYLHQVIALKLPRWRSLWNVARVLPGGRPLQSVYAWLPELANQLEALIRPQEGRSPYDVVHVEHLRGAEYGLWVKNLMRREKWSIPVVWDSVDSISLLFRQAMVRSPSLFSRSLTRLELGRTEHYEGAVLNRFDQVTVTSENDRQALLALLPHGQPEPRISVLPNGVDLDYFQLDSSIIREDNSLVISGKMSYHANVAMVHYLMNEIMPGVWQRCPETRVVIVGKDPPPSIQELVKNPRITVTGTVEHLPPYLQRAAVAVAPIAYGAGIQNKVLEAMACGAPVVASRQAVSAIQAKPGREVIVADSASEFAGAIVELLENPQKRAVLGQAGRDYVERQHHWTTVAENLEALYANAIHKPEERS